MTQTVWSDCDITLFAPPTQADTNSLVSQAPAVILPQMIIVRDRAHAQVAAKCSHESWCQIDHALLSILGGRNEDTSSRQIQISQTEV